MEFFICILSVAVIAVGGWLIMKGQMDYVDLITFSLYITTFISPIRKLANFAEMFSNGFAGLHRFIELMRHGAHHSGRPRCRGAVAGPGRRWTLDHVSFTYPGSTRGASRHRSHRGRRGDGGHRRPLRRRQEHPVPAGTPVL